MRETPLQPAVSSTVHLRKLARYSGLRVLAWDGQWLYACRGYQVVRLKISQNDEHIEHDTNWELVARFRPEFWRSVTSRLPLTYRLVRDGFHALSVLASRSVTMNDEPTMVAAVPGAIVTRAPDSEEFALTHKILRGTRPLHITAVPGGNIYWGEYFDNRERAEVHIYVSADRGQTWHVGYTFPAGSIRHIHNIVHDPWGDCVWILTGDEEEECKVLRASCDLCSVDEVLSGSQQARAVAVIPTKDALYLSTDTPSERNHILRMERTGNIERVADLGSSSIFGCQTASALFFSTMAEPSEVNTTRNVDLVGSADGDEWQVLVRWQKDGWPMRYFQYGNILLPDGNNTTNYLAATAVAVKQDDLTTTLWEVETPGDTYERKQPLSV
jgi:hypothetical protein